MFSNGIPKYNEPEKFTFNEPNRALALEISIAIFIMLCLFVLWWFV